VNWRERRLDPASDRIVVRGVRPDEPPITGPDKCPACGRTLVIRIEFDRGGTARVAALAWAVALAALAMGVIRWAC